MAERILLVFATQVEAEVLKEFTGNPVSGSSFNTGNSDFEILITGAGGIATAWSLKNRFCSGSMPDLVVNLGIAGSYREEFRPGDVVMPVRDCFADLGIEIEDRFIALADTPFMDKNAFPFRNGFLECKNIYTERLGRSLRKVNAVSANTVSGSPTSIERLKNDLDPDIETMEGASFFYICAREKVDFLAVRSISNMVEPVRKSWDIQLALNSLAGSIHEILLMLV
jgi:futalosine hydrolase